MDQPRTAPRVGGKLLGQDPHQLGGLPEIGDGDGFFAEHLGHTLQPLDLPELLEGGLGVEGEGVLDAGRRGGGGRVVPAQADLPALPLLLKDKVGSQGVGQPVLLVLVEGPGGDGVIHAQGGGKDEEDHDKVLPRPYLGDAEQAGVGHRGPGPPSQPKDQLHHQRVDPQEEQARAQDEGGGDH